ncbi:MAG: stage II sporulation protein M [Candidatus Nanoarchaeia archaeon]|nr:stage II sporulation protein M [Candidatus Nanoarchaeia archaeon]
MVFERLFAGEIKKRWLFLISVAYSSIGLAISRLLFGANSGIVAIVFTSLLFLPIMKKIFEKKEKIKKGWFSFYSLNKNVIWSYFVIFLGVFLVFTIYSFLLPQLGFDTLSILKEQLFIDPALRGSAFDIGIMGSIFMNNFWVLLVCFVLSLFFVEGGVFFIIWNASAWGSIVGYRALTAATASGESAVIYLLLILLITFPHFFLESMAYILAATSGAKISLLISNLRLVKKFFLVLGGSILLFAVVYMFFYYFNQFLLLKLFSVVLGIGLVYLLKNLFYQDRVGLIKYNYYYFLFISAFFLFLLGAIVETFVLMNCNTLIEIYNYSYLFIGG